MRLTKTAAIVSSIVMGFAGMQAQAAPVQDKPLVDTMVSINTSKLRAIKDSGGQILFVTDNGRFAIVGQMIDVKNKKTLFTIEDIAAAVGANISEDRVARQIASRIEVMQGEIERMERGDEPRPAAAPAPAPAPVKAAAPTAKPAPAPSALAGDPVEEITIDLAAKGFDLSKTNHITVGQGSEHVTVLVDPQCIWCHRMLEEIVKDADILKSFVLDVVVVNILGDESRKLSERLACANATDKQRFHALVAGKEAIEKLPQKLLCNKSLVRGSNRMMNKLGVSAVPFAVAPDKRFARGKPRVFREFLQMPKVGEKVNGPSDDEVAFDLEKEGFKLSETNHITLGTGPDVVTVFVDPQCGWCHRLIEDIEGVEDEFFKKYTLNMVVVSILGDESRRLSKKLACSTASAKDKYKAFLDGAESIDALPQKAKCDDSIVARTAAIQEKMSLYSVPFVVTSDKRVSKGKPADILDFVRPRNK